MSYIIGVQLQLCYIITTCSVTVCTHLREDCDQGPVVSKEFNTSLRYPPYEFLIQAAS